MDFTRRNASQHDPSRRREPPGGVMSVASRAVGIEERTVKPERDAGGGPRRIGPRGVGTCVVALTIGVMLLTGGTAGARSQSTAAKKFEAATDRYNVQMVKTQTVLNDLGSYRTIAPLAKALAPLTKAAERWETAVSDIRWPKADRPDAQTLVIAIAGEIGVIGSISAQTDLTMSTWSAQLGDSADTTYSADNALRHDLGLPE